MYISALTIEHCLGTDLRWEFTQAPQPKCAACWGHHSLDLCCCCKDGMTQRPSAFSSDTKLGTCPKKVCRPAVQKKGRCQWNYSFEAECLLFALPQLPHTAGRQLCRGVVGDYLPDVQHGQSSKHALAEALVILHDMGDNVNSCPAFADMFTKINEKLAFVKRVKPYMWVGIEGGIRSSFCTGVPVAPLGTCTSCQQLQKIISNRVSSAIMIAV